MADVTIDGKVYKEVKIKNLIVDGKEQSGFVLAADQLKGKDQVQVTIEAEPTLEKSKEIES